MRVKHIAWNLAGLSAPLLVAVLTIPKLIHILGSERFGLLALAWGLIGYAGVLDLGIGRALTQMVARYLGEKNYNVIPSALTTATFITMLAGLAGAIGIAALAYLGAYSWVKVSATPSTEIKAAMLLLAIALPVQAMSATYRGVNEAFLNFKGISLLRAGLGVVNFAGPFLVSNVTIELPWLISTLVLSRLLALLIFRHLAMSCFRKLPELTDPGRFSKEVARSLFSFGGWVTISSIISPIMVQADRFVIGATISAAAVSIYVIPYEMVTQSLIVVGAISSVAFPELSRIIRETPSEWLPWFNRWLIKVAILMLLVTVAIAISLPTILPLWVRGSFDPRSVVVGQLLCIGVFANSIGSMYYALLHAGGRAFSTAKIHMFELPFYIALLVILLRTMGVSGAAWAWTIRMIMDCLLLMRSAHIYTSHKG